MFYTNLELLPGKLVTHKRKRSKIMKTHTRFYNSEATKQCHKYDLPNPCILHTKHQSVLMHLLFLQLSMMKSLMVRMDSSYVVHTNKCITVHIAFQRKPFCIFQQMNEYAWNRIKKEKWKNTTGDRLFVGRIGSQGCCRVV